MSLSSSTPASTFSLALTVSAVSLAVSAAVCVASFYYLSPRGSGRKRHEVRNHVILDDRSCPVTHVRRNNSTVVSLSVPHLHGAIPFTLPFCSAVLTDDGHISISGTIGIAKVHYCVANSLLLSLLQHTFIYILTLQPALFLICSRATSTGSLLS
jgi:hypothetical protein